MIGMIGEANQKHLDWKLKEKALELFRRLEQISELPRFDGACVDFHQKRPAMVFIAEKELISQVENGELPGFLVAQGVRRVLVDALWPTNVAILKQLIESGVEVWVLTRPSALHGWRRKKNSGKPKGLVEWLERHHPEVLEGFKTQIKYDKNDVYDAVLLRYVSPKFHMRITEEHIERWVAMILWRRARRDHQGLLQQLSALPLTEEEKAKRIRRSEEELLEEAKSFVETMIRTFPRINELFDRIGIEESLIDLAYCCEVLIETEGSRSLADFLKKLGLSLDNNGKTGEKFIHDGQAAFAINQLAVKVYRIDLNRERSRVKGKCKKLATKIWKYRTRCLEVVAQLGGETPSDRPSERG
ncbi:MAG: hypothetical protein NYU90_06695 [Aigarchaeota archaeon]|nr:hypothetical protein [Candidatus Calditenuis fumarioli]